ncbi:DUF5053 domain-containing protein [uncultured Duncaniella sp.]|uniref:DUF5053 domain-containing protein n=1 Tax=uncultured Duncaniella sp. TaxID=2768039 RepID=UPI0026136FC0|nr:DUF5053 domain-containing protein [uncultured Duncaniella sp.]
MKQRIDKWKRMVADNDPMADQYLKDITAEAKSEGKIDEMNEAIAYLIKSADSHLDNIEKKVGEYTMHQRLGNLSEVINLAYIARHYFGKTRQWLYQRVKGQMVNGKPASFTPEEEATFLGALNDIGLQIATLTQRV